MVNNAVFAPIPSAITKITASVNPGESRNVRSRYRKSRSKSPKARMVPFLLVSYCPYFLTVEDRFGFVKLPRPLHEPIVFPRKKEGRPDAPVSGAEPAFVGLIAYEPWASDS